MKVMIPSALRSYTKASETDADGATLAAVLADLDCRYSGIRFRMIDEQERNTDEVVIVQALSGG
jgi:sulfur-carrier protein